MADKHLVFVPRHTGYELAERDGDPPNPGEEVSLDGDEMYVVVKVSPSPLPDDGRLCAYLQAR
jgi:hypothetical protein